MKITLNQDEIEIAIVNFIRGEGLPIDNKSIAIQLITGTELSANITIVGKKLDTESKPLLQAEAASPAPVASVPAVSESPKTLAETPVETEPDREAIKAKLDQLGIDYAPKTRTATLQSLLEDASASTTEEDDSSPFGTPTPTATTAPVEEETSNLFGNISTSETPAPAKAAVVEDDDDEDQRPLFGN